MWLHTAGKRLCICVSVEGKGGMKASASQLVSLICNTTDGPMSRHPERSRTGAFSVPLRPCVESGAEVTTNGVPKSQSVAIGRPIPAVVRASSEEKDGRM